MPGGAGREDVERGVFGQHRRSRRRVVGRRGGGQPFQLVDTSGSVAAPHSLTASTRSASAIKDLRVQQAHAVGQHVAALVVVEHAGDGAAFDDGQHHQHRVRRVAQHDPDDVAPADAARGQHRGIAVGGGVGFAVAELLVVEAQEDPVAVAGGAFLEHLADRRLGGRPGKQPGERAAQRSPARRPAGRAAGRRCRPARPMCGSRVAFGHGVPLFAERSRRPA